MFRTILTYLASVATYFAVSSCSHQEIDMIAACDVIPGKGYVVKWDIYPKIEGHVKVYISEDPGKFDLSRPIAEAAHRPELYARLADCRPEDCRDCAYYCRHCGRCMIDDREENRR